MPNLSPKSGYFITVEGIEGVGKSTSIANIKKFLDEAGLDLVLTREPGGTAVAEKIREVLLMKQTEQILPETELLLLFAGRAQHVNHVIQPALEKGKTVVCDRFTEASYAYQGYGRGIPLRHISNLESWVQGRIRPDLTLLLDAPVKVALKRAQKRGKPDRFESETVRFFERVRKGYHMRAQRYPSRYRIINASRSPGQVKKEILAVLQQFLVQKGVLAK